MTSNTQLPTSAKRQETMLSTPLSSGSELLDSLLGEGAITLSNTTLVEHMPVVHMSEPYWLLDSVEDAAKPAPKRPSQSARDCAVERLERIISTDRAKVNRSRADRSRADLITEPVAA